VAGFLEERRQHVPKSTIIIDEQDAATGGNLRHQESLYSESRKRSVMLTLAQGEL
jgi:hypothetical protein